MISTWKILGVQDCLHFIVEWTRFECHWFGVSLHLSRDGWSKDLHLAGAVPETSPLGTIAADLLMPLAALPLVLACPG